jgi:protein disulfide-isomerase A1
LAKVDAVSDTVLSERFQILSFPMLKLFVDGIPIEYNSGRKAELIMQWLKKKTGPTYVVLNTIEEFKAIRFKCSFNFSLINIFTI